MKHLYIITLILGLTLSYNFANAQSKSNIGIGLNYGSEIENIGFDFRGDFKVGSGWAITPDIALFLPKDRGGYTQNWSAVNLNAHYIFGLSRAVGFYPLFGINYTSVKVKNNNTSVTNNEIGLNIGMGLEWYFNSRITGFTEMKYVICDLDQAEFTFGILIGI